MTTTPAIRDELERIVVNLKEARDKLADITKDLDALARHVLDNRKPAGKPYANCCCRQKHPGWRYRESYCPYRLQCVDGTF